MERSEKKEKEREEKKKEKKEEGSPLRKLHLGKGYSFHSGRLHF